MAIIIEQEKRKINWFAFILIILLVAIIGAVIYYLFFAATPFVERVIPSRLQSLNELSSIKLEPEAVINNPSFQILKQYVNSIEIQDNFVGKANPFAK